MEPLPVRRPHLHARDAAGRRVDPRRLPGVGRARWSGADGPNDLEPAALVVAPELARVAGPHRRGHRRGTRSWPAAARPGSSRARMPELARRAGRRDRRRDAHRPPVASSGRSVGDGVRRWLLVATLVARAAKHLLVLLLPHALAALLDQRTHEEETLPACRTRHQPARAARSRAVAWAWTTLAGSSMAEHLTLDQGVGGSSPPPPARKCLVDRYGPRRPRALRSLQTADVSPDVSHIWGSDGGRRWLGRRRERRRCGGSAAGGWCGSTGSTPRRDGERPRQLGTYDSRRAAQHAALAGGRERPAGAGSADGGVGGRRVVGDAHPRRPEDAHDVRVGRPAREGRPRLDPAQPCWSAAMSAAG